MAGSRSIKDRAVVEEAVEEAPFDVDEIVHGACRVGVDKSADQLAQDEDIEVKTFPAEWKKYEKAAGPIRNKEMAEYADALIAVWDGESRGTKNMIRTALNHDLQVYVKNIGPQSMDGDQR